MTAFIIFLASTLAIGAAVAQASGSLADVALPDEAQSEPIGLAEFMAHHCEGKGRIYDCCECRWYAVPYKALKCSHPLHPNNTSKEK